MIFLILGLLLGTLVGFFTATLMVCAAHAEREDAVGRPMATGDAGEGRRVAAAVRG